MALMRMTVMGSIIVLIGEVRSPGKLLMRMMLLARPST